MTAAVLDASVVLSAYQHGEGPDVLAAHELRRRLLAGSLRVLAPRLLYLEVLNVAARRWRWSAPALAALADGLERAGYEVTEPPLELVAEWTAGGLSAYDAFYVALADANGIPLVTLDREILRLAPAVAQAL